MPKPVEHTTPRGTTGGSPPLSRGCDLLSCLGVRQARAKNPGSCCRCCGRRWRRRAAPKVPERERETVSMMRPGTIILFHFKYFVSRWTISLYNKVSLPRFLITKHDDEGEGFYRQSLTGERFARQAKSIATHLVGGVRIHSSCHFFFFLSFFSIRILFSLHLILHVHLFFIITYITNYFIRSWLLFSFLSCSWVHWGYS